MIIGNVSANGMKDVNCTEMLLLKCYIVMVQGLKTESGKFHEILTSVCVGGSKNFFIPPVENCYCVWGSKTFYIPPEKLLVCVGGSKN